MKAFTDFEQSKKLAKILPLESADMHWQYIEEDNGQLQWFCLPKDLSINKHDVISAWSLAALIDILPVDLWGYTDHYFLEISKMGDASKPNEVRYFRFKKNILDTSDRITHILHSAENLVDACVNMIFTLHTHKFLSNK